MIIPNFRKNLVWAVILITGARLYAWENEFTHPAITEQAVNDNEARVDDYLKTQLGLSDGLSAQLYWDFPPDKTQGINNARK